MQVRGDYDIMTRVIMTGAGLHWRGGRPTRVVERIVTFLPLASPSIAAADHQFNPTAGSPRNLMSRRSKATAAPTRRPRRSRGRIT